MVIESRPLRISRNFLLSTATGQRPRDSSVPGFLPALPALGRALELRCGTCSQHLFFLSPVSWMRTSGLGSANSPPKNLQDLVSWGISLETPRCTSGDLVHTNAHTNSATCTQASAPGTRAHTCHAHTPVSAQRVMGSSVAAAARCGVGRLTLHVSVPSVNGPGASFCRHHTILNSSC